MGPFLPLFGLEVEHAFFPDGACRGLQVAPTAASARRLERCGCLWRRTDRGLVALFDASAGEALRMHAGDADDPLCIQLLARSADPHFANYTEGAFGSPDDLLVLDSRYAQPDEATGRWRLRTRADAGDADPAPASPAQALPTLSSHERRSPPHFVVTLHVAPDDVPRTASQARRYVCRLQARATVWKYYLFGDLVDPGEQVEVVDVGRAHRFDAAVDERLDDGQRVLAVRSAAPIALQDRPPHRFQLRRRGPGADQVLVKRLPVASPSRIHREVLGGVPTWISEIYVHR